MKLSVRFMISLRKISTGLTRGENVFAAASGMRRSGELHQRNFHTGRDGRTRALNFLSEREGWEPRRKIQSSANIVGLLSRRWGLLKLGARVALTFPLDCNS